MSIKVVLFDLDGVLVDACEWHYEALNRALLDVAGLEISREDHLETYNGLPTKVKLGMLRDQGLVREDQEEDIYRLKQENTVDAISAFAETDISKVEMFEALRDAGIKAACVTNSIRETAEKALKTSGLFDFLEFIVTNEDVRSPKPHPEGYIRAMIRFGVMPENVLIFEDSPKGLEAANLTGCNIVQIDSPDDLSSEMIGRHIKLCS